MTADGGADPLDFDTLLSNPSDYFFPATDAMTGNPHYFTKEDIKDHDTRPFMATCALPVMCKPVQIGGHFYFDGGVTDSLPIGKLRKKGCDRIVVLFSKPDDFHMEPQSIRAIYTMALQKYPRIIYRLNHRHEVYNREVDHIIALREHGMAMTFAPTDKIHMSTTTMDTDLMQALYDNGYEDAKNRMDALKTFIGYANSFE